MPNKAQNEAQNIILDSISEGAFTADPDWRITSFNHAAEEITGIQHQKAMGKFCRDVLRTDVYETDCTLRQTMEAGNPIMNKAVP